MGNLNFVSKPKKLKSSSNAKWKILIADDDIEVHNITKTVLSNFEFDNIGLEFISVFSGKEAIKIWMSADEDRIPLKIRANMFIGGVEVDVTEYKK